MKNKNWHVFNALFLAKDISIEEIDELENKGTNTKKDEYYQLSKTRIDINEVIYYMESDNEGFITFRFKNACTIEIKEDIEIIDALFEI